MSNNLIGPQWAMIIKETSAQVCTTQQQNVTILDVGVMHHRHIFHHTLDTVMYLSFSVLQNKQKAKIYCRS